MKKAIAILLVSMAFVGCGKFADGTSVWAGGLWTLPLICFLGGCFFLWKGYMASKSGSAINPKYGGGEGGNVPFLKTGWPILGFGLWLGAIGIIIWQNLEK